MIVYFTDRKLNLYGSASTELPGGLRIIDDLTTEEISSGVNVFTCVISCDNSTRFNLERGHLSGISYLNPEAALSVKRKTAMISFIK